VQAADPDQDVIVGGDLPPREIVAAVDAVPSDALLND
jgi:hypothetical protein